MKEQFVPYQLALKLKELGFDEKVLAEYDINEDFIFYSEMDGNTIISCKAPLWQQAFDWFRKEYKLEVLFTKDSFNKGLREYKIISIDESIVLEDYVDQKYWIRNGCFKTYNEARLACLEKLIEIISENKL